MKRKLNEAIQKKLSNTKLNFIPSLITLILFSTKRSVKIFILENNVFHLLVVNCFIVILYYNVEGGHVVQFR